MKTRIYFVRHGKAENPKDIWYGRMQGFPLSEQGKQEISQTADFLKTKNIDQIFSSPLTRTQQTAQIIQQKLNLDTIFFSDNLLEVNSSLQGKPYSYLESISFDIFASQQNNIQGETIDRVLKRTEDFIQQQQKLNTDKNIVAVSHGDTIMVVLAKVNNLPITNHTIHQTLKPYVAHGEVLLLEIEEGKPMTIQSVFKPAL